MDISKIKLFSLLETNLKYTGERQEVLASNIANANTPGYGAQDVKPLDFRKVYKSVDRSVVLNATAPGHITSARASGGFGASEISNRNTFEISPTGNKVVLEQEVMKVAKNSMEYQKTTSIYKKMINMMKTALGENA